MLSNLQKYKQLMDVLHSVCAVRCPDLVDTSTFAWRYVPTTRLMQEAKRVGGQLPALDRDLRQTDSPG